MEEDLLQTLDKVEAMIDGIDEDSEIIDGPADLSLGSDDMDDSEFLNEYKSTFNFIDSELDALRSSMDDVNMSSSANQGDKKDDADDSSYSSSSDRSPFQMPTIDEMSLNMGLESSEIEKSQREEELEIETKKMETDKEFEMEQEIEEKSEQVAEVETAKDYETQEKSAVEATIAGTSQSSVELEPIKQSSEESSANMQTMLKKEPQVNFEARPQVPPLDQTKNKPSQHSFHLLTTLISIALAFLTGQRFPKQDLGCYSPAMEVPDMDVLLQPPRDFQAFDLNTLNSHNNFLPEAVESLSFGDKAGHAAAIHEALEEHMVDSENYHLSTVPEIKTEEAFYEDIELYFEDTGDVNIALEDTYFEFGEEFGKISSTDWATPKLLEMMESQGMETVYVIYEEPYADQSINLHFGVAEYDGLFISMEMMHFIEPLCLL
ncbi:unnamed protein product [Cylindrotheca closterium]|uniref:Uncharacterized protein n=1 Tax=Cylindrotheca closterium TaxID=2856 RepID=A0AAD2JKE1_9STRA|nr:unnamed protein product [Cylindrotheca closterium]